MTDFDYNEGLSMTIPEAADCFLVPKDQWHELCKDLRQTSPIRERLMQNFVGLVGGGSLACLINIVAGTATTDIQKMAYWGGFIVLGVLCGFFILAAKSSTESTAEVVLGKMKIVEKGLRTIGPKSASQRTYSPRHSGMAPDGYSDFVTKVRRKDPTITKTSK